MLRTLFITAFLCCLVFAQTSQFPPLLQLTNYQFSNTYGCGSYESGALYLSQQSQSMNTPELLLDGYCGQTPYATAATSGNNLGFISDIGMVMLQNVTCQDAVHMTQSYIQTDGASVLLQEGHTYLVCNSFQSLRTYWGFTVNSMQSTLTSNQVQITHTIYLYEVITAQQTSPGFEWDVYPGSNTTSN